jgi:hypothetical protein
VPPTNGLCENCGGLFSAVYSAQLRTHTLYYTYIMMGRQVRYKNNCVVTRETTAGGRKSQTVGGDG